MTKNKTQPAARTKRAGQKGLASTWLDYCGNPSCHQARELVAAHLDELFKSRLPFGFFDGVLEGREDDIRQEAFVLAMSKYLAGNPELMAATAGGRLEEIDNQIRKSVNGSINAALRDLLRSLLRHHAYHEYMADPESLPQGTCDHPARRQVLWDLPKDLQRAIVVAALKGAAAEKRVSARGADAVISMVEEELSQAALAKKLGVSRQSMNERIAPVRMLIASLIEKQEFPLT